MRPADAYRARHRSPADAYRAKYRDAGSVLDQCALADLRVEGIVSASLVGLPDDLWRQICAFGQPATCGCALVVAAGRSASLQHALRAEVAQTERSLFGMTRGEAEQILRSEGYLFPGSSISKAFLRVLSPKHTQPSDLIPDHESAFSRLDLIYDDGATLRLARAFLAYGVDPESRLREEVGRKDGAYDNARTGIRRVGRRGGARGSTHQKRRRRARYLQSRLHAPGLRVQKPTNLAP